MKAEIRKVMQHPNARSRVRSRDRQYRRTMGFDQTFQAGCPAGFVRGSS
jgi:hypothetical protein